MVNLKKIIKLINTPRVVIIDPLVMLNSIFIYVYYFYGVGTRLKYELNSSILIHVVYEFFIFICFLTLNHIFLKYKICYKIKLGYTPFRILWASILLIIFGFVYRSILFSEINGDQLYHAYASIGHIVIIIKKVSSITLLKSLPVKIFVHLYLFLVVTSFIILYFILEKYKSYKTVIIIAAIGLLIRIMMIYIFDGIPHTHPPLRTFFLQFSTTIFGFSNFGLRISSYLILFPILYLLSPNNFSEKKLENILIQIILMITPIVIYTSMIVEFSIYTFSFYSIFYFLFYKYNTFEDENVLFLLIVLICIGILTRITMIPLLVVVFVLFRKFLLIRKEYILIPFLVISPFLINLFLGNHPAINTNSPSEDFNLKNYINLFPIIINSLYNNYWILSFLILFPIFSNIYGKKYILLLFFFTICQFYLIRYVLWGANRYQIEIWGPLFLTSIMLISQIIKNKYFLYCVYFFGLIIPTLYFQLNLKKMNKKPENFKFDYYNDVKLMGGIFIQSEVVLPIQKIFKYRKLSNFTDSLILYKLDLSDDYILMHAILSDFSFSNLNKHRISHVANINFSESYMKNIFITTTLNEFKKVKENASSKISFYKEFHSDATFGEDLVLFKFY